MNENEQKNLISDFFLEKHHLTTERIPEGNSKTPDLKVFKDHEFAFYCEIKSLNDPWLDEELAKTLPLTLVGGSRPDPTFNRVSSAITRAAKQLMAANPEREKPNVLALINFDDASDEQDLLAVLTGNFYADNGSIHPIYKNYSEGRIKELKPLFDLFIWVQIESGKKPLYRLYFNHGSSHLEKIASFFNYQPSEKPEYIMSA